MWIKKLIRITNEYKWYGHQNFMLGYNDCLIVYYKKKMSAILCILWITYAW